jgi:hypothetical protein
VGLDLGQRQDYSAVAVMERDEQRLACLAPCMRVRHLERMPLGTPYVDVVRRVSEIMRHPALTPALGPGSRLVVDATGVGAPVVEMLRAARPMFRVTAVTITGGDKAQGNGEEWRVPKRDLMAGLQVMLEERRLKIPRSLKESATLVRELTDVRLHSKAGGRVRIGAEGHGEHDDLALAVALACWRARKVEAGREPQQRLPGL